MPYPLNIFNFYPLMDRLDRSPGCVPRSRQSLSTPGVQFSPIVAGEIYQAYIYASRSRCF